MNVVAVTGLHRGENPQPGAAVIASLRRKFPDLRIIGLSYDPLESSLYGCGEGHPDAAYLIPYPGVGADALLHRLDEIRQQEHLEVIIPCLDSEIENFQAIQAELEKRDIRCILPSRRAFQARSKENLATFCRRFDIPTAQSRIARTHAEIEAAAEEIGYPVYIKGKHYEANIAYSRHEIFNAYSDITRVWGWPVIVQEVIFGEEYDVTGLGDGEGGIVQYCAIRKIMRTSRGKGFAGVVIEDPALDELVRHIIEGLRWDGPFELEFLKATGKPHALFEINPRFPAWIDFPSQIGCNLPARLLERELGWKQGPLQDCKAGQMFVRHCVDLVGDVADLAEMASTGSRLNIPAKIQAGTES